MADNVIADAGAGGATFAADDILGVHYPRTKLVIGADGTNDGDVSSANPLPISDASGSLTVDGTITANLSATDNAVLDAIEADTTTIAGAVNGSEMQVDVVSFPSAVTGSGSLTAPAQEVNIAPTSGRSSVVVQVTGTWTGQLEFEVSADGGTTYLARGLHNGVDTVNATAGNGLFRVDLGAVTNFRVRASALSAGTAVVSVRAEIGSISSLTQPLPTGTNAIGKLAANSGVDIGDVDVTSIAAGDNNIGNVDIVTVPAPLSTTGGGTEATALRVTVASDSTGVLSVDDNASSLTVDGSVSITGAVDTELTTADLDTGAGTDTRAVVGLVGSASGGGELIPGSATNGLLVNLGANNDVTLVSTTITGTVAVTQSGTWDEVGINDSGNAITVDWNGTAPPIGAGVEATALRVTLATDSTGVVSVDDNGSAITVDNGGTFAVQESGAALTALQLIDDTVYVDDADWTDDTSKHILIGGVYQSAPHTVTDGDVSPALMDVNGRLIVAATDNGGSLTIDGTVTANLSATDNAVLDAIESDTTTIAGAVSGSEMQVDVITLPASTNTLEVVGDVAHSAAAAGNPVLVCGVSQNNDDTVPPNRVDAESDATRIATDWDGCVHVRTHGPQIWSYHLDTSTAQTDTQVHAATGVATTSIYVTDIVFSSGAATAINLFFEEGASKVLGPYYLEAVAGRGMAIHFQTPKKITANTALTLTTSASIAHSVDVTGFIAQG